MIGNGNSSELYTSALPLNALVDSVVPVKPLSIKPLFTIFELGFELLGATSLTESVRFRRTK